MYNASRYMRLHKEVSTVAPKRNVSFLHTLKKPYHAFNEYFGLETAGDKVFFHGFVWFCILMLLCVMLPSQILLNNLN